MEKCVNTQDLDRCIKSVQAYIIFFTLTIRYKLTFAELMRIYFEWGAFPGVLEVWVRVHVADV